MRDNGYIQKRVLGIIEGRSSTNPILSKDLEDRLSISGPVIRDAVRALRRIGEPIVATEHGYFMARNAKEVQLVINDLQARIESMSKTIRAIRSKSFEKFGRENQQEFGFADKRVLRATTSRETKTDEPSDQEREKRDVLPMPANSVTDEQKYISEPCEDPALNALLLEDITTGVDINRGSE